MPKKLKLNQIVAIEKGVKQRTYSVETDLYQKAQQESLYYGFTKTYTPKDENGEARPPETKTIALRADEVLTEVEVTLAEIFDVTATKDFGNMVAKADVKVGETLLATDVPVPYLLFLEKQLGNLRTFVAKMPTLTEANDWTKEEASGLFKTAPVVTYRTEKLQRPIVLYDATDKHPAQTQLITEDVTVGTWSAIHSSGALTKRQKQLLLNNIDAVLEAVKFAREEANGIEVEENHAGSDILNYVFKIPNL